MQLTNCQVCDGKVSTSALACPHCGHPINSTTKTKESGQKEGFAQIIKWMPMVFGVILSLYGVDVDVEPPET
jgi:predicted amidophosphoribosyltransferase